MKERKEQKQHQKGQIPHIQQLLESDLKTFQDMPIVRAILERYTEAASPEWYKKGHYLGDVYRAKVMRDTAIERVTREDARRKKAFLTTGKPPKVG